MWASPQWSEKHQQWGEGIPKKSNSVSGCSFPSFFNILFIYLFLMNCEYYVSNRFQSQSRQRWGSSNTLDWNAPYVSRFTGNRWKYHKWALKGHQHQRSILNLQTIWRNLLKGQAWSCIAKCWLWFDRMRCLQGAGGINHNPAPCWQWLTEHQTHLGAV